MITIEILNRETGKVAFSQDVEEDAVSSALRRARLTAETWMNIDKKGNFIGRVKPEPEEVSEETGGEA